MNEKLIKYPRSMHLMHSPGTTSDDRILVSHDHFHRQHVVITEKLDGENATLNCEKVHARSLDSGFHPSRSAVRAIHGEIKHLIPAGFRICGENMYAKHSLEYDSLPSYFMVFSIWNNDKCLSWEDTVLWANLLGLNTVPVLFSGKWEDIDFVKLSSGKSVYGAEREGYVVRLASSFKFDDFGTSLAKFVRTKHVQTDTHWMSKQIVPNKLA